MIKIKDLEVNKEYYIIDYDNKDNNAIIKFKVIQKLKNGNVKVQFLSYLYDEYLDDNWGFIDWEEDIEDEIVIKKLKKEDEERLFKIDEIKEAKNYLAEMIAMRKMIEIPEYEYPDWDGDSSLMYYLDNYKDEDNDENWDNKEEYEI